MDQIRAVRTIEELVFEVLLWPYDVVRLFALALLPWKAREYVVDEWNKPPDQRFKDGMSPVFFWLIAAVVPSFLFFDHFFQQLLTREPELAYLQLPPWPLRLFLFSLFLSAFPLSCSIILSKYHDTAWNRDRLKRLFFTNCIVLVPTLLLLFVPVAIMAWAPSLMAHVRFWIVILPLLTSIYASSPLAISELRGWKRIVDAAFGYLWRAIIFFFMVTIAGGILVSVARTPLILSYSP